VQLLVERGLRQAEIARGGVEMAAGAVARTAVPPAGAEQREVAGLDPLLQLGALLLRQPARGHRGVHPVGQRLLERVRELRRLHAELLGRVVDHRLALLRGRPGLGRGDRGPAARDREPGDRSGDDLALQLVHRWHLSFGVPDGRIRPPAPEAGVSDS
jgi:hypothetical protein